ncbi:MAG: PDZ domain-containing protein, partial [Enterobacterales bacterium]|nr:PDZ domain-containing protein [Enterobacterales bacterium]
KPITVDVTLEQSQQSQVASSNVFAGIEGAELSNVTTGNVKGVKVDNVQKGSTAARVGLQKGDIILGVNQQPVANLGELRKIMDSKPPVLALNIQRGDNSLYLLMQ